MDQTPHFALLATIASAAQHVKMAARGAAQRCVDSLGVSALASANVFQRDALLGAQFELNRKLAVFCTSFNTTSTRSSSARSCRARPSRRPRSAPAGTRSAWSTTSEVEVQVCAERFGMQISQACEGELRELDSFVGALLQAGGNEQPRNPLRPEAIGHAMIRGIDEVTDRSELRKVLLAELERSLAASMPQTYASIVADLRAAGVKPAALSIKSGDRSRGAFARSTSGYDTSSRPVGLDDAGARDSVSGLHGIDTAGPGSERGRFSSGGHGAVRDPVRGSTRPGTPIGEVDAGLMTLIRRLAHVDVPADMWTAASRARAPHRCPAAGRPMARRACGRPRT